MMKKLLKITEIATLPKRPLFPNYQSLETMIAQVEDFNRDFVKISRPYLLHFREIGRQRALR